MEEKPLSDEQIIHDLQETHSVVFSGICDGCTHNVIDLVMNNFDNAKICIQRLGKGENLFHLGIMVGNDVDEDEMEEE